MKAKHHPSPTVSTNTPPNAGPIRRAPLKITEFSASTFAKSSCATKSTTSDCRTGKSNALINHRPVAMAIASAPVIRLLSVSTDSNVTSKVMPICVVSTSRRRSQRSTITPVNKPKNKIGPWLQNANIPSNTGDDTPKRQMSQPRAMVWTQLPMTDSNCPPKNRR
nr:hypothetical protein [Candidatus Sodalis endolongispinus]